MTSQKKKDSNEIIIILTTTCHLNVEMLARNDCCHNSNVEWNIFSEEKQIRMKRRRRSRQKQQGRERLRVVHNGLLMRLMFWSVFSSACVIVYCFSFSNVNGIQRYKARQSTMDRSWNLIDRAGSWCKRQRTNKNFQLAYRIEPDQLEQLKESVDIVSAIESYGLPRFKRSGANRATAICPFHDDKNPSLSIDGKRKLYKCFSCGAGGDIFQFVREYNKISNGEELSYYQAVRLVNEQFATDSPLALLDGTGESSFMDAEEMRKLAAQKERLLLCNAEAAAFYANNLISLQGGPARSHLSSRGLTASTVRTFAIGFAPDAYYGNNKESTTPRAWGEGSLVHHLRDRGFSPQEIIDAGLAIQTNPSDESQQLQSQGGSVEISVTNATTTNSANGTKFLSILISRIATANSHIYVSTLLKNVFLFFSCA